MENRLEKAMLKANEAQSIQKTYEQVRLSQVVLPNEVLVVEDPRPLTYFPAVSLPQVLERMRQDQLGAELRSRTVEEAMRAAVKEHDRLLISSKEAQHEKDAAVQVGRSGGQ